jgi:hypothetical protein
MLTGVADEGRRPDFGEGRRSTDDILQLGCACAGIFQRRGDEEGGWLVFCSALPNS